MIQITLAFIIAYFITLGIFKYGFAVLTILAKITFTLTLTIIILYAHSDHEIFDLPTIHQIASTSINTTMYVLNYVRSEYL